MKNPKVISIGEVLWDALPKGIYLGGAPLNVAVNLQNLGIDCRMISAVGNDQLGNLASKYMTKRGLDTSLIQHNDFNTGLVEVEIDENGVPDYNIHENVAWDHIIETEHLRKAIFDSDVIVIGSLIFRSVVSANTIKNLLINKLCDAKVVLDVNFRKSFYSKELIEELLKVADIVKLNDEELCEIQNWYGLDSDYQKSLLLLKERFGLESILLTRGENGSTILTDNGFMEKEIFLIKVKDTVGAGDAFLAGAIYCKLKEMSPDYTITFANAMGAFVASRNGATPKLDIESVNRNFRLVK